MQTAALDQRIGTLSNGQFYAFANGYDQPEVRGTRKEVEAALGLRAAPAKVAKRRATKAYQVTGVYKFPDCYNHGFEFEIFAASKLDAIKAARSMARDEGHTRMDGPLIFTAKEV